MKRGGALDLDTLRQQVSTLSREAFVREHSGYYLVVTPHPETLIIGYRTVNISLRNSKQPQEPGHFEVVPIAKAPKSPYRDRVSIGRATNCDIVLRDASVSKLHAHFHDFELGPLKVVDLGSSNGTKVNNGLIEAQEPVVLESGDTLQLGAVKARVADGGALYEFLK